MDTDALDTLTNRAVALIENHSRLLSKLVYLREKQGLSQAEVAQRMGVGVRTVARFERYDANPTLSTLRLYALCIGARIESQVIDDNRPDLDEVNAS